MDNSSWRFAGRLPKVIMTAKEKQRRKVTMVGAAAKYSTWRRTKSGKVPMTLAKVEGHKP